MLRKQMDDLITEVKAQIELVVIAFDDGDPHWRVCQRVAQHFQLYDNEGCFPTWLSRIVDGEIRDLVESKASEDPERWDGQS